MKDLIAALTIFLKYKNERYPTCCEHDRLMVVGISEEEVSDEDKATLKELGFIWSSGGECEDCWVSFRFGSA
jgi:hypothetical protein